MAEQCREVQRLLPAYLDGEVVAPETFHRLAGHLEVCDACRRVKEAEEALRAHLRELLPAEAAPPHLVERLHAELDTIDTARARSVPLSVPARRPLLARRLWLQVAAAILLFVVGIGTGAALLRLEQSAFPSPVLVELVQEHLTASWADRPVEVQSANTEQVATWLRAAIDRPVPVPDYSTSGITLVGARLVPLAEGRAPVIVYRKGYRLLSLFALPVPAMSAGLEETTWQGHTYWQGEYRGVRILLWKQASGVYALASELDWQALFECASKLLRMTHA